MASPGGLCSRSGESCLFSSVKRVSSASAASNAFLAGSDCAAMSADSFCMIGDWRGSEAAHAQAKMK